MIIQSGRAVIRLPQLSLQCLGSRRTGLGYLNTQRVALYNAFESRKSFDYALIDSFLTSIIRRAYATTKPVSRPKAHTGRTTTAARKAPTTSKTKAAKKPAAKKTSPKAIPQDGTKAVPKTRSKAKTTAKPKAKPRIKPKPTSAKKAKAKPKSKSKALTKEEKKEAKDKKVIKDLRVVALKPPHGTPSTAWTVFNSEVVKSHAGGGAFGQTIKESAAQFKDLSPERLEHYNHIANQNKAANAIAYRQWIESHTPTAIHEANLARANLKRKKVKGYNNKLQDHRQVTGRRNAFAYFSKDRHATGDFKGLKIAETARLCGREWKGLSASEKKPYEDAAAADMARYVQETKTVYNKDVKHKAAAPAA